MTCSRLSVHSSKVILLYLIGGLTLEKGVDATFVIRIENSLNKKASLTPVFITNKCPVLVFISQVTLFKFTLSKHYPAACKSKQTLCKNYHLSLYLQCLPHDILQLVH